MKKVLLFAVVALLATSVSAFAAYTYNWTDGFERYANGALDGQGPWIESGGASTVSPIVQDTLVYAGNKAVSQAKGVSQAQADMRFLNSNGVTYTKGYAKFWVYDPGNNGTVQTDGRVGLMSSGNPAPGGDNVSEIFSAQIQTNNATDFWEAQWSWSAVMMDGVSAPTAAGYTFVPGLAAPRIHNAWNYVMITWAYTYTSADKSTGSAVIKYYVNQASVSPNLTLNIDNTTTRWAGTKDIAGVVIGALYADSTPTSFDSVEFHANAIPEPSSLLALGTGMVGLLGLIRRRK